MNPNEPIETKEELIRLLQLRLDVILSVPEFDPSELVDLAWDKAARIEAEIEDTRVAACRALDIAMEAIGRLGLDRPNPFPTCPASLSAAKHTFFNLITFYSNGDKGKVTAETSAPSEDAPPADPPPPREDATLSMTRVLELVGDTSAMQIMEIARVSNLSADEKLQLIAAIDVRFEGWRSERLGDLLGVTDAAIRQLPTWKKWRKR